MTTLMNVELLVLVVVGGFIGGLITTLAGLGGALVLIAILSTVLPPHEVVGLTAPALLVGNIIRVGMLWGEVDQSVVRWFWLGSVPATLLGAFVLPSVPAYLLKAGMAVLLIAFIANRFGVTLPSIELSISPRGFSLVGAAYGLVSAIIGGAGPISAPFLYNYGLTKEGFVGTSAAAAFVANTLKTVVFISIGLLAVGDIPTSIALAVAVAVGSGVGRVLLAHISERLFERLLLTVLTLLAVRLVVG